MLWRYLLEEIPFHESMNVIIIFTDKCNDDEARYYKKDWQSAEKQASNDYKTGNVKSAKNVDDMFEEIGKNTDGKKCNAAHKSFRR